MNPLVEAFLEMLSAERGASARTLEAYGPDLKRLHAFLRSDAGEDAAPEVASSPQLRAFLRAEADSGLSARTQARRLSTLREFYRFLYSESIRADNPAARLESPRRGRPLPRCLSERQVRQLIKGARTQDTPAMRRLAAMLELVYAAGLRVSELVSLPLAAVVRDHPVLTVRGKGNKERMIPLTGMARTAVQDYLEVRHCFLNRGRPSRWLFPSTGKSGHLTRDGFFKQLRRHAIRCGVDEKAVSPHVFRHSFASHLVAHDADLRSVQQMLGHADIATTEIYTHIQDDRLFRLVETGHPLAEGKNLEKISGSGTLEEDATDTDKEKL